jgi:hypothetical protein
MGSEDAAKCIAIALKIAASQLKGALPDNQDVNIPWALIDVSALHIRITTLPVDYPARYSTGFLMFTTRRYSIAMRSTIPS